MTDIRIVDDGDGRFSIVDSRGRDIGWIRGRAARFTGFVSESAVMDAARRAWRALEPFRQRAHRLSRRSELGNLHFVHDGAYEWVSDGVMPVARIIRPRADEAGIRGSFAIEWILPADRNQGTSFTAARAIAAAMWELLLAPPTDASQLIPSRGL